MDDPFKIRPDGDEGEAVPGALREGLRRAYHPRSPIDAPSSMDDRMGMLARQRLAGRVASVSGRMHGLSSARWRRPLRIGALSALAATVVLGVFVGPRFMTPAPRPSTLVGAALHGDIDGDGRVDIVDALVLSNGLKSGDAPPAAWDVDNDGAVSDADARAIRAMVVTLARSAG
jgi:hypothetical protein